MNDAWSHTNILGTASDMPIVEGPYWHVWFSQLHANAAKMCKQPNEANLVSQMGEFDVALRNSMNHVLGERACCRKSYIIVRAPIQ